MVKKTKSIETTLELRHKVGRAVSVFDSKLALNITNFDVLFAVHGARDASIPCYTMYEALFNLEGSVRDAFFDHSLFNNEETVNVDEYVEAVFNFRGFEQTDEKEYVVNYEYTGVRKIE